MHRNITNNHYGHPDEIYQDLVNRAMEHGFVKSDRTGTGTHALFGEMARYNLINGRTPRLTTKKLSDNPEREMLWFRDGTSSIKTLRDQGIGIWNSWLIEGTAKYREKTYDELLENLRKKLKVDAIIAGYITHAEYDEVIQSKKGINHYGRYVIQISLKEESLFKTATVYGSDDEFDNHEDMVKHVATDLKVDMQVLVDGDIGPGGYGPQWRHWQDTQIVDSDQVDLYRKQGYESVGVTFDAIDEKPLLADKVVMHREIDQLANAIELLKTNPDSRRIIVTAWNPAKTWQAALPPCHLYFQFVSHELTVEQRVRIHNDSIQLAQHDERREESKNGMANLVLRTWNYIGLAQERASGKTDEQLHAYLDQLQIKRRGLSLFLLLRSQDAGLGNPFNIAQYAALNHMVAQVVGMEPLELCWAAVDCHVYNNHLDALKDQVKLTPLDHCIPRLKLNPKITDIDAFTIDDIEVIDYEHYQALTDRMPVAV